MRRLNACLVFSVAKKAEPMSELAQQLQMKALCESDHPATAVSALLAAAAAILVVRFDPPTVADLMQQIVSESLSLHMPAGHA